MWTKERGRSVETSWWRRILRLKRCWLLTALPLGLLLEAAAAGNQNFAEWYAANFYPGLSKTGNLISGLLPFSLGEWVVIFSAIAAVVFLVFQAVQLIRKKGDRLFYGKIIFEPVLCGGACPAGICTLLWNQLPPHLVCRVKRAGGTRVLSGGVGGAV